MRVELLFFLLAVCVCEVGLNTSKLELLELFRSRFVHTLGIEWSVWCARGALVVARLSSSTMGSSWAVMSPAPPLVSGPQSLSMVYFVHGNSSKAYSWFCFGWFCPRALQAADRTPPPLLSLKCSE